MGAGAGFDYLAQAGAQNAARHSSHKQQLSDEERQGHYDQITQGIAGAQTKLATLQPNTPEYDQVQKQITDAHVALTDLFHPDTGPGALAHLGRIVSEKLLHRQPETQAPTVRTLPQGGATPPVAATSAPGMVPGTTIDTPQLPALPASHVFVPPPLSQPEQLKRNAAEKMTQLGMAATPNPMRDAAQTAEFNRQQTGLNNDALISWAKKNNLPSEALDELKEHVLGLPMAKAAKPLTGAKPYQSGDGKYYISVQDPTTGLISAEAMPPDYVPPPPPPHAMSNAAQQRAEYASSHNLDPTKPLSWKQEIDFQKQLFSAHNPYAGFRANLAQRSFDLREQEAGLKDFMALQKQLTPLERTAGTAANVDDYIQNPTGPGDVALTLAFFDAIKTTGVRFTKQEQDFIVHSRGLMEGFEAQYNRGFTGTVLGGDQRKIVGDIVKKAAALAEHQQNTLIGGAGQFRPKVAAAAKKGAEKGGASVDDIVNALNKKK